MPQVSKIPKTEAQLVAVLARFLTLRVEKATSEKATGLLKSVFQRWCDEVAPISWAEFPEMVAQIDLFAEVVRQWNAQTGLVEGLPNLHPVVQALLDAYQPEAEDGPDGLPTLLKSCDLVGIFSDRDDPMIYLYPKVLAKYQKSHVLQRGVFYTPREVVRFMIDGIGEILDEQFGVIDQIASGHTGSGHRLVFLDPAAGTGAFIINLLRKIHKVMNNDPSVSTEVRHQRWVDFVLEPLNGLLQRLHGFEIMPVSWALLHINLGLELGLQGVVLPKGTFFFKIRCADALQPMDLSADDFCLVLGNPPYKGISSNQTDWINGLLEDYKYVQGVHFSEKKHWLHDDYVKFLRLGQHVVDQSGQGLLAYVQPHGFLTNPTFRGLRWNIWSSFEKLWVVDLHGNLRRRVQGVEPDENVFDIQQGVCIGFLLRGSNESSELPGQMKYHAIFGKRSAKLEWLNTKGLKDVSWTEVHPHTEQLDYHFMVPKNLGSLSTYVDGFSITDLFVRVTSGIVTARDALVVDTNPDLLLDRIKRFADTRATDDAVRRQFFGHRRSGKYPAGDTRGWRLGKARRTIQDQPHVEKIRPINYRPFDTRYIYFDSAMVDWPRIPVMRHFIADNIGLIFKRGDVDDRSAPIFSTRHMIDFRSWSRPGMQGGDYVAPIYLYTESGRQMNVNPSIVSGVCKKLNLPESSETALDLVHYIYGMAHHPEYRSRYSELLAFDAPRFPLPTSKAQFYRHVQTGARLLRIHAQDHAEKTSFKIESAGRKDLLIERYHYSKGRIWLNGEQCISGVPESVWHAFVGGYQPAQKWLHARKNVQLTKREMGTYLMVLSKINKGGTVVFSKY